MSDHLPCFVSFKILNSKQLPPKHYNIRQISDKAIKEFWNDLLKTNISSHLNSNLIVDTNLEYWKIVDITQNLYQKHFPEKKSKTNHRYVHNFSNWITSGIAKSIEFRYDFYKTWKMSPYDSSDYSVLGYDFVLYNRYLNQFIQTAKMSFICANLQNIKTTSEQHCTH